VRSVGLQADMANIYKLDDPACQCSVEEFGPKGQVTARIGIAYPELHIVLKGKVEVDFNTCRTPGDWFNKKFIAEPGDAYFLDPGDQVQYTILEPYRHFAVLMPALGFAAPAKPENEP
jgi:hypothetical protein